MTATSAAVASSGSLDVDRHGRFVPVVEVDVLDRALAVGEAAHDEVAERLGLREVDDALLEELEARRGSAR